jgi:hypothetical protein
VKGGREVENHSCTPGLLFVIRYPALDPIRSDPRYADLMCRLGLPE